jgi:hypothetical protein
MVLTLRDETGKPAQKWVLDIVVPLKYTGAALAAEGSAQAAMEELVLAAESVELEPPP